MLDAAFELFAERGYQATTMAEVARRAGVAQQTVYFTFHTKADLLRAAIVSRRTGPDGTGEIAAMAWVGEAMAELDQRRTLAMIAEHGSEIFSRLAPIADAMTAAALTDPELGDHLQRTTHERRQGMTAMVAALARKGPLLVSEPEAVDILGVIQSMATYNAFVADAGWTVEQYKVWAYRSLTLLLPPLSPAASRRADRAATAGTTFHEALFRQLDTETTPAPPPSPSNPSKQEQA
jgi:AcrR family transcriptional regulator